MRTVHQILSLVTCLLLIMAVSIRRDGRLFGYDLQPANGTTVLTDTLRTLADGTIIINTTDLGKDIIGYSGRVPLEITIRDGVVIHVEALKNAESPDYFGHAAVLLSAWDGITIEQALAKEVDAVSGATYSSEAIIGNMDRGLSYVAQNNQKNSFWSRFNFSVKALVGLLVALLAAILPLFIHDRRYHIVQQILNVAVLGFWCGTFINYTALISYFSNGINIAVLTPLVLLIIAFIYPLFGKKGYYCVNVCPFGSLQELAGKCVPYKISMSAQTVHILDITRELLWAILMLCMWTGMWFDWIDCEPFAAFVVQSASWIVISIAILFVVLSTVIMRPYCRFVCPTGTLLKISQSSSFNKHPKQ